MIIIQSDPSENGGGDADVSQGDFTGVGFGQAGLGKRQGQRAVGVDHDTGSGIVTLTGHTRKEAPSACIQATALADSHSLNALVRNRFKMCLLSKWRWT